MESKKSVFEMLEEEELQAISDPQNFASQSDLQKEEEHGKELQNLEPEPQVMAPQMDPIAENLDRRREMLEIEAMLQLPYFDFQYQLSVALKYHWLSAELQTESLSSMKHILASHLKQFYPDLQERVKNLKKANYLNLIVASPEQQRLNICLSCLLSNRTLQLKMAEINRIILENSEFQLQAVAPILQAVYELLQPHQENLVQQFIQTTVAEVKGPIKPVEQDTNSMLMVIREHFTGKKLPKDITSIFEFLIKKIQDELDFLIPDLDAATLFKFQIIDNILVHNEHSNPVDATATSSHYFLELNYFNHQKKQLKLQEQITKMFKSYSLDSSQGIKKRSLSKAPEVLVIFINRTHFNGIVFVTGKFTVRLSTHLKFQTDEQTTAYYQIQSIVNGEFKEHGDEMFVEDYNALVFHDEDFFKFTSNSLIFYERGMKPSEVEYEEKLGKYPWVLVYGRL